MSSNTTVKKRLTSLEAQIDTINTVLQNHQQQIEKGARLLQEHCGKIKSLEELIARPVVSQPLVPTRPADQRRLDSR